ncbi:HPr family phosphocarrier protein [Chlamydia gallinacea]|uniref:HPr family phosphocarrier protein n=1 Tax=Chlamydia gallinacea TaxID=1457153 RepID=A0ABS7IT00_9CHLA|nr:HPr family phosphocarrier protein [Chlamydia gallinacea]MBX6679750.1 HPr family phosphocarrier protein [Chlamydia gallinacea]MBX6687952.1 HPr family phosphocarrier protein [Chlamydia gallinacea]
MVRELFAYIVKDLIVGEFKEHSLDIGERQEIATTCYDPEEECTGTCVVKNASGVHVRPASAIVKLLAGEDCEVSFTYAEKTVNAKSIMSILILGAPQNGKIYVRIRGKNAYRVLQKLQNAFDSGFGEL